VLSFFFAFGFFYGLLAGKKKLLGALFALYVAILLFANFSYLDFFAPDEDILDIFLFRMAGFAILVILLAILFNKTIFLGPERKKRWWQVFVLSFLEVGLLMSALIQLLPAKNLFDFSPAVETLFASEDAFFWWLILPLPALFFIVRNKS
jgi:H+/Cl- antiporter ClcA